MDGGKPGGNIRPVFMYRPDRVTLLKTSGGRGGPSDAQKLETLKDESLSLKYNPGRVDPENAAWARSRKAISAVFDFNGERVFVINNHWKSKLGSGPLFGSLQPSSNGGVASRMAQSQVVVDFVKEIMTLDPTANVVVQGDFNEFQMVQPLLMLAAAGVTDLMEHHMAPSERYSYVYDGNSQALDHILVSGNLLGKSRVEVLHLNTLNPKNEGASDHDPVLSSINLCKKKRKFSSI